MAPHNMESKDQVEQLIRTGQASRALEVCDRLIQSSHDRPDAHVLRGWACFEAGDYRGCRDSSAFAVALGAGEGIDFLFRLAKSQLLLGDLDEARDMIEKAATVCRPDDAAMVPLVGSVIRELQALGHPLGPTSAAFLNMGRPSYVSPHQPHREGQAARKPKRYRVTV